MYGNVMRVFSTGWSEEFDGPGRRWMVYLKGCNFRCRWCANPESVSSEPEMLFYPERASQGKARGKGEFLDRACPHGAVARRNGRWVLDRERCVQCLDRFCVKTWRHPAFELAGEDISVGEIITRARQYRSLFGNDGGVTFGGGEPMLQADEALRAIEGLRADGIHTAIETNASAPQVARFFGAVDLLICDLKCVSPEVHRAWTGTDNTRTLETLRAAAMEQPGLLIRVPLVPGMNDSEDETERIADFLEELARRRGSSSLNVEILRLHHVGEPKYAALELPYAMSGVTPPSRERALGFQERLTARGIKAAVA